VNTVHRKVFSKLLIPIIHLHFLYIFFIVIFFIQETCQSLPSSLPIPRVNDEIDYRICYRIRNFYFYLLIVIVLRNQCNLPGVDLRPISDSNILYSLGTCTRSSADEV